MPTVKVIGISAKVKFLPEHSNTKEKRFAFSYTITVVNHGKIGARLLGRHWIITDANGRSQEVIGKGVIGKQPLILPDKSFTYTSGTLLPTPVGSMQGKYKMIGQDGIFFDAHIKPFTLAMPALVH